VSVWLFKPAFDSFVEKELTIPYGAFFIILILLGIAVLVGLFAGSYPAFFLSSFQPIKVLKGRFKANPQSAWLRKGLVVVQFSISIILIIGTFIIIRQMEFTQQKNWAMTKSMWYWCGSIIVASAPTANGLKPCCSRNQILPVFLLCLVNQAVFMIILR
jgi:uncharacterized protein YneF (UPF0154 family)